MRKEYPLEDQTRRDKDDEMFGRGKDLDFRKLDPVNGISLTGPGNDSEQQK